MTAEFSWDDPNRLFAEIRNMLAESGERIQRVPDMAVRRGTFELLRRVQERVPKKTNSLVKSVTAVVRRISADVIEGKVGTWLEYARYVEEGTGIYGPKKRPISIVAKHKKALFWGAYDENGKPIMAKKVSIKGMKPRAPFGRAVAEFLPRYVEIIREELNREAAA